MGASEITSIILGVLTLLGGCGWFVEGRKHRETARLLNADHKLKEMELGQLYVEQFEKNIAEPLRRDVRELREKLSLSANLIRKSRRPVNLNPLRTTRLMFTP